MDKNLNELLKWSIEAQTNGSGSGSSNTATGPVLPETRSQLTPEILQSLMGGPSDAELMQQSMAVITSADPEVTLETRLVAFDNFEQLIESLDNANNMGSLGLWGPLLKTLESEEPEVRKYAAWCVGTAVQNNEQSQERLLAMGGLPALVKIALSGEEKEDVRRKAIYALSSATRNYQPACDVVTDELVKEGHREAGAAKVDATDMDSVDVVMNNLKDKVKNDAAKASA